MEMLFSPLVVAVFAALAVLALGLALRPSPHVQAVKERAETYLELSPEEDSAEALRALEGSFIQRAVAPVAKRLLSVMGRLGPASTLEDLQQRLTIAGRPGGLTAADFLGLCILLAAIGVVLGLVFGRFFPTDPLLTILRVAACGALGYLAPRYWLISRIRKRKDRIERSLPDALDMLTICVEAGLAFEAAMLRVSERWAGPLSDEFSRVVAEIRLGVLRSQALRRMAQRCGSSDVSSFVAVLVQADSMGTSIAQVVHSQSDQLRVLRRQRAEEKANKAPIKILIPMVLFIFPALFVVILGPGVPKILEALGGAGGG